MRISTASSTTITRHLGLLLAAQALGLAIAVSPAVAAKKTLPPPAKLEGKYHALSDTETTYIVRLNPEGKATVTRTETQADGQNKTKLEPGTWATKEGEIVIKHAEFEDRFEYVPKARSKLLEGPHPALRHVSSAKSGSPLETLELFKHPLRYRRGI